MNTQEDVKLKNAVTALLAVSHSPRLSEAERGLVVSTADLLGRAVAPAPRQEPDADRPGVHEAQ
jgi:hypothetical protein